MKGVDYTMKKRPEMLAHVILSGLTEVCAVLVFGALAYHFKHWWIALFSILYTVTYKEETTTTKQEDKEDTEHE